MAPEHIELWKQLKSGKLCNPLFYSTCQGNRLGFFARLPPTDLCGTTWLQSPGPCAFKAAYQWTLLTAVADGDNWVNKKPASSWSIYSTGRISNAPLEEPHSRA